MGARKEPGKLRIIGGEWRGRKLPVADLAGLRPTTDRIRETVFNWLAPEIVGRRCLDLFAGTGALGLEALSRGADHCQFVENQGTAAALLEQALDTLQAGSRGTVSRQDALHWIAGTADQFDLVFLDPPFDGDLLARTLFALQGANILATDAIAYLEYPPDRDPPVPTEWSCRRSKQSGGVTYALFDCTRG